MLKTMKKILSILGFTRNQNPIKIEVKEELPLKQGIKVSHTVYPDGKPRLSSFSNTPWYGQ